MSEAEQVVEVTKEEAKRRRDRALDHIAEIWVEMSGTDAWQELQKKLDAQVSALKLAAAEAIMQEAPIDQRQVDRTRGMIEGLQLPAKLISVARGRLERKDKGEEPEPVEEGVGDLW